MRSDGAVETVMRWILVALAVPALLLALLWLAATADLLSRPQHRAPGRTVAERCAGPVRIVAVAEADHNDATLCSGDQFVGAVIDLATRVRDSL
jgi:hypothetical protein